MSDQKKGNVLQQIFETGDLPPVKYQLVVDNRDLIRVGIAVIVTAVVSAVLVSLVRKTIKNG